MTTLPLRALPLVVALASPAFAQQAPLPPGSLRNNPLQNRPNFQRPQFNPPHPATSNPSATPPTPNRPPPTLNRPSGVVTPPPPAPGERQIRPTTPVAEEQPTGGRRNQPTCEEVRKKAKYGIYFDKVDLEKLVQTVSDATCKTFIIPENFRGKISIVGPENGRMEVSADEFYAAFLAALDANNLAVAPSGKFMKIVDKRSAKQNTIPTYVDPDAEVTTNDQMVTKLFKVKNVEVEPLRGVLQQLATKDGDCIPYAPDTLICNDIGSNMHRLEKIMEQLDTKASTDEVRVVQVKYASAQDIANTLQKIFETKGRGPGRVANAPGAAPVQNVPAPAGGAEGAGGPVTLSQLIPDERTNKLVIVASPAAYARIQQLLNELDVPISGEGRINVYPLENANAEDMAGTLQSLAQGTANKPRGGAPPGVQTQQARPAGGGVQAAELFSGEVKISADKATNSLVIIASQSDYRNLVRVIEKLDLPRRQVFVEAVIMEVNLDHNTTAGVSLHQGFEVPTSAGSVPVILATKYTTQGLPPSFSIANLASFGGFLAGVQGPVIPELAKLGLSIPSFGVVLHALTVSNDANVLSTPHLLTSDNEEAEITVGQNVPFQAGFSPSNLGTLTGATGATGATGLGGLGLGAALGGLGSYYAPINRQNVELKLTIKPQINESDFIRLAINEQTEEIASQDPVLGPTTSKRSAKTVVVARNQETVVIGGIMQDRTIESVSKIPVLGDIPLLGHLFRETQTRKVKTNLLLFLTPYIIRDQSDFQNIFRRKMQERQQFVEQFYGQVAGYDVAVDFTRKGGPLGKLNQAVLKQEMKVENGGPGAPGEKVIAPQAVPGSIAPQSSGSEAPAAGSEPAAQPPAGQQPATEPPAPPNVETPTSVPAPAPETNAPGVER